MPYMYTQSLSRTISRFLQWSHYRQRNNDHLQKATRCFNHHLLYSWPAQPGSTSTPFVVQTPASMSPLALQHTPSALACGGRNMCRYPSLFVVCLSHPQSKPIYKQVCVLMMIIMSFMSQNHDIITRDVIEFWKFSPCGIRLNLRKRNEPMNGA